MADTAFESQERGLKHLNFARVAAAQAVMCLASLYELAKDNAGPLKGGVQSVEGTVKSIMKPVYDNFHDFPLEILFFADCKVDYFLSKLYTFIPSTLTSVTRTTYNGAQNLSAALREILSDIRQAGFSHGLKSVYERYEPAAQDLYKQYEPLAEHFAVAVWVRLNCLPLFPQVAHMLVPTAAYWAEKYNGVVEHAIAKEMMIVRYLPEIPIERIAKVFSGVNEGEDGSSTSSSSEAEDEAVATSEPVERSETGETVFADVADSPDLASE